MVSVDVLGAHLAALLLTWAGAWATGLPLAWLLRLRIGFAGSALLGVAYWAVALYCFPFAGGMLAAAIPGIAVVAALRKPAAWQWLRLSVRQLGWADGVLWLGSAAYLSLLVTQYVPPGMDASMHTTAARLIAQNLGLPATYAPFAPDVPFLRVNLGLPAFTAVVVRAGADPASAMLACEHLTFSGFLLGTYLLLRLWVPRLPAALAALLSAWAARNAQETAGWGGFPTVMSMALGLLALRLLFDVARRPRLRPALALGLVIASLPLVHGVGAAIWLYAAAPAATIAAIVAARHRRAAVRQLAVAGAMAGCVLAAYRLNGAPAPTPEQLAWVRHWQSGYAPEGSGWQLALAACHHLKTYSGSLAIYPALAAAVVLLWRRRFLPVLAAAVVALSLVGLIANARLWLLPGSFLLYPERVVYLGPPLGAMVLALGWQALPPAWRACRWLPAVAVVALFAVAVPRQVHYFQRIAMPPSLPADGWAVLCWARDHLDPRTTFVEAPYASAGSYLPGVAGIACSGWHFHCFVPDRALDGFHARPPTHVLLELENADHTALPANRVVFRSGRFLLATAGPPAGARAGAGGRRD